GRAPRPTDRAPGPCPLAVRSDPPPPALPCAPMWQGECQARDAEKRAVTRGDEEDAWGRFARVRASRRSALDAGERLEADAVEAMQARRVQPEVLDLRPGHAP